MATKTEKRQRIVSPAVVGRFLSLLVPNTKYNKAGEYVALVALNPKDKAHKAFLTKIDKLTDDAFAAMKKEHPKYAKTMKRVSPIKPEVDENGKKTGLVTMKFRQVSQVVSEKSGKSYTFHVAVFDAQGRPVPDSLKIGSGTTLKVAFTTDPYFSAKDKEAGLSLRLAAAQILDLVEWEGGDAKSYGFEEEEGFNASSFEASDDDEEDDEEDQEDDEEEEEEDEF